MLPTTAPNLSTSNPFLTLAYEPAFAGLGDDYYDIVAAAEFPQHVLRFRNDDVLPTIGLNPETIEDGDFIGAFGYFAAPHPFLAMRYHGYQFGEYNSQLGDGRGFLYGQVRGVDGELYDFGTKGTGRTPYSRTADGRLTLKGGVREVIAAEALHRQGVRTSRCFSLVETGEALWRGDEPSPTRSSVMVRFSRSHIRFGTFERLHYLNRPDLSQKLLDHVLEYYYPHLVKQDDRHTRFYAELVEKVANLVAQWLSAGFCHAVLNTDNMSITGESFDYGPYAFINQYDPHFIAAYFDYYGRYSYSNQPEACYWNLQKLQAPLKGIIDPSSMESALDRFSSIVQTVYRDRMIHRLGFVLEPTSDLGEGIAIEVGEELLKRTIQLLWESKVIYHDFFASLRLQFDRTWRDDPQLIFAQAIDPAVSNDAAMQALDQWRQFYHQILTSLPESEMDRIAQRLVQHNPITVPIRAEIEAIWEPIVAEDDWQPFYNLLKRIQE